MASAHFAGKDTREYQLEKDKDYGDCAAPKILAWAHSQQNQSVGARRTPIALVEIWFDPSHQNKTVTYGHGGIIGPCQHCQKLLPWMLTGRAVAKTKGADLIEADQKRARDLAAIRENQRKQRAHNARRQAWQQLKVKSARIENLFKSREEGELLKRWQIFVKREDLQTVKEACGDLLSVLVWENDNFLERAKNYIGEIDVGTREGEEQESEDGESEEQESEDGESEEQESEQEKKGDAKEEGEDVGYEGEIDMRNGQAATGENTQRKRRKRKRNRRKRGTLTRILLFVVAAFVMAAVVLIVFAWLS
jgi:hypothetical protein